ncbi:unnamed protein product [Phytomonas sp. EM1]|nr:unnamed protein product [Phytomonas sp. EM1]|eukprot:CCW60294.1 unnamed protein product [Phytomonas sp. isolate EM1]
MNDDGIHLRRLFPAPDNPYEILATSNKPCVVQIQCEDPNLKVPCVVSDTDATPRVKLPCPPRSICWYPLKAGAENASFLTACQSQPLQLWDLADGLQRASYVAYNNSGQHADPLSALWLEKPHTGLIAGGYGGFEDKHHVRLFDVLYQGDNAVMSYRSRVGSAVGATCALANGPCQLVLSSYFKSDVVEAIDLRNCCPALMLRGMHKGGTACIHSHPSDEHRVYVSGYKGSEFIYAWDLRRCMEPVALFHREMSTHQVCDFAFAKPDAQDSSSETWVLVSSTSAGGLLVFPGEGEADAKGVVHGSQRYQDQLGPTGGLAALLDGRLVVTLGPCIRSFRRTPAERPVPAVREAPNPPTEPPGGADLSDAEFEDAAVSLRFPLGLRRPREPLSESDSEDSFDGESWCARRKEGTLLNATIISL